MNTTLRLLQWSTVYMGIVIIAGCGNGTQLTQIPLESEQTSISEGLSAQRLDQPDRGRSWMDPRAKAGRLLYISDAGAGDVHVYTYPEGKSVGELTGFSMPGGECSDGNGNVWITNFSGSTIVEYAHGGTRRIATLSDPGFQPQGCSVDPVTGNLAVAAYSKTVNGPSQPGAFAIYAKASGAPRLYSVPFAVTSFCGYDNKGNLFVDGFGWDEQPLFALVELPKRNTSVKSIAVNQTIGEPGAVQWDAKQLLIGDNEAKSIYEFTIHGGYATEVGAVSVNFGEGHMGQYWVQGSKLIVTAYIGSAPSVLFYTYPGGAGPIKTITGLGHPAGVAVSLPPK